MAAASAAEQITRPEPLAFRYAQGSERVRSIVILVGAAGVDARWKAAGPDQGTTVGHIYVDPHMWGVLKLKVPQAPQDANPRLSTLLEVEAILVQNLKDWEGPLSYAEIGRRMSARKVRPAVVRACVQELVRQGRAIIGSKGVDLVVRSPALEKTRTERLA